MLEFSSSVEQGTLSKGLSQENPLNNALVTGSTPVTPTLNII